MTTYTITLSTAEDADLSSVAVSQNDWIDNAVHECCRVAIEKIVAITVQKCLDSNTQIPESKDAMFELSFNQGWVKTAAQRQDEMQARIAEIAAQSDNMKE